MKNVTVLKKRIYVHRDRNSTMGYFTKQKPTKSDGRYSVSMAAYPDDRYRYFNYDMRELLNLPDVPPESLYEVELNVRIKKLE